MGSLAEFTNIQIRRVREEEMNFGLKALACLLLYPDAALKDNLPEIKEGVGGSSLSDDQKDKLYIFINHLAETPLSDLQKDYVSTFDIGKKASLNLFGAYARRFA